MSIQPEIYPLEFNPWILSRPISYGFKNYKSDQAVAAYLGFYNLGEFRKFRMSFLCIEPYDLYDRICRDGDRIADRIHAIQYLCEFIEDVARFPATENAIIAKYRLHVATGNDALTADQIRENGEALFQRYAAILYKAKLNFDAIATQDLSTLAEKQETTLLSFENQNGRQPIPRFDISTLRLPQLGPHRHFDENIAEPYNRIAITLSSLTTILHPVRWSALVTNKKTSLYDDKTIDSKWKPSFMKKDYNYLPLGMVQEAVTKKPRDFFLQFVRRPGSSNDRILKRHYFDNMEDRNVRFPPDSLKITDPTIFENGQEWRDHARYSLSLPEAGLNFQRIEAVWTADDQSGSAVIHNPEHNGNTMDWDDFKAALGSSNATKVEFRCKLQPLEDLEDDYPWEWDTIPTSLTVDSEVNDANDTTT